MCWVGYLEGGAYHVIGRDAHHVLGGTVLAVCGVGSLGRGVFINVCCRDAHVLGGIIWAGALVMCWWDRLACAGWDHFLGITFLRSVQKVEVCKTWVLH